MIEDKKEMLFTYMKANEVPILTSIISASDLSGAIVLDANISVNELNGHYEGADFIPPKWFNEIISSNESKILVIDKIDTISKEEQLKFCEILKYRKVSTFSLPDNCVIIITSNEISKEKINEEIFSLVACI